MNLKNVNWMKIASVGTTVVGMGLTVANEWLAEKNLDTKISKKVEEAIAALNLNKDSKKGEES